MKWHLLLTLLFAAGIGLAGCAGSKQDSAGAPPAGAWEGMPAPATIEARDSSGGRKDPAPIDRQAMLDRKSDLILTVAEYQQERTRDLLGASQKYAGKTVEVKGTVRAFSESSQVQNEIYVHLVPEKSNQEEGGIVDAFLCKVIDPEPWTDVAPGTTITLKGFMDSVGITLVNAIILDRGHDVALAVNANEFMSEFLRDRDAASKKYDNRFLRVTGELQAVENWEQAGYVDFKVEGGNLLRCIFETTFEKYWKGRCKPGSTVHILAKFYGLDHGINLAGVDDILNDDGVKTGTFIRFDDGIPFTPSN